MSGTDNQEWHNWGKHVSVNISGFTVILAEQMAEDWQYVDKKYFWTTLKILSWGWWWWWQHQWKQDVTRPSCQHQGCVAPQLKEDFPPDPTLLRLASWCPAILASESFNIDIISGQFRCNFLFRLEDKMQKNRNYKIQLFVHTSRPI